MTHKKFLVLATVYFALFALVATPQRRNEVAFIQNHGPEVAQSSGTTAKTKRSFPLPNWMVKYDSGSLGLKADQWLRIAFVSQAVSSQIQNSSVTVSADQVVAVEFNAKTERESDLLQSPRSGCSSARGMMPNTSKNEPEVMVAMAVVPGRVTRLAERLNSKHPIRFVWKEGDRQGSMLVEVNDCEYQSFMANVRWVVGVRWQEVGREFVK